MAEPRRSFGPTVLAGLGGAALAAVSAGQEWASASGRAGGADVTEGVQGSDSAPLAVALALVALAAWGVVLVVRGRARQVMAIVGAGASVGVVAATLVALSRARADAVEALVARGASGDGVSGSLSGWYWATLLAATLTLLAFAAAVRLAPGWPTMSSRYDAPASQTTEATGGAPDLSTADERDLWKAFDEGRDPTA